MDFKFNTTHGSLFTQQNSEQVPAWMADLADNLQVKEQHVGDWEVPQRGVFAYHNTVQRFSDDDASLRDHTNLPNVERLKHEARVALSRFLAHKRYRVDDSVGGSGAVELHVTLEGVPATFAFPFEVEGNRVQHGRTFFVEGSASYPFSKVGLDECLQDIKQGRLLTAKKPGPLLGKHVLISREEIIRRFNGQVHEALAAIETHLKEGALVGVGSNTYGSFFDVDTLFPQAESSYVEAAQEFAFVANREHVSANPQRSARLLAIDASKVLSHTFDDVTLLTAARDGDELLVKARVFNELSGTRDEVDFAFAIDNERLAGVSFAELRDVRLGMQQLIEQLSREGGPVLERYLQHTRTAASRPHARVMSKRDIHQKLHGVVSPEGTERLIHAWLQAGELQALNSTTYATQATFEELLRHAQVEVLPEAEAASLRAHARYYGEGLEVDTTALKPQLDRVRELDDLDPSLPHRLNTLTAHVGTYFQHFTLGTYEPLPEGLRVHLNFVDPTSGVAHDVPVEAAFQQHKLLRATAYVGDTRVSLAQLAQSFTHSPLLQAYLQDGRSRVDHPIVITLGALQRRLKTLAGERGTALVDTWLREGRLTPLHDNLYAAPHSLETLLAQSDVAPLTDAELADVHEVTRFFGEGLHMRTSRDADTGVRDIQVYVNDERLFTAATAHLAQHFKHYKPLDFFQDDANHVLRVELSDEHSGLRHTVDFVFHFDDATVTACELALGHKRVALATAQKALALSDTLSTYLGQRAGERVIAPILMQVADAHRRLRAVTAEAPETVLATWANNGLIEYTDSKTFVSPYTFEELLERSDVVALNESALAERIARAAQAKHLQLRPREYVSDTGSRAPEEGPWSAERLATHVQSTVNQVFKDFELLDATLVNGASPNNLLVTRVGFVNPFSGVREKLSFFFGLDGGRPTGEVRFLANDADSRTEHMNKLGDCLMQRAQAHEAVAQYNKLEGRVPHTAQQGILHQQQLTQALRHVVAAADVPGAIAELVQTGLLTPLNSHSYASNNTLPELVQRLANTGYVDLRQGEVQRSQAARVAPVNMAPDYHLRETGSRDLSENDSRVAELLADGKRKTGAALQAALEAQRITPRLHAELTASLDAASGFQGVETVIKTLRASMS